MLNVLKMDVAGLFNDDKRLKTLVEYVWIVPGTQNTPRAGIDIHITSTVTTHHEVEDITDIFDSSYMVRQRPEVEFKNANLRKSRDFCQALFINVSFLWIFPQV
jgi:hypothetical protein